MEQTVPRQPFLAGKRLLIAALILGAITAGLIVAFLASRDSGTIAPAIGESTVEVIVARQEIPVGTTITEGMVEVRELPTDAVISGAATDLETVVGETTRFTLFQGEQVSVGRLVSPPSARSLSFTIPEGMRGFTVPVDVTRSPASLIVPGDFVDILVVFELIEQSPEGGLRNIEVEGGNALRSAVTFLQNIQVLAVQRDFVDQGVAYDSSTRGEPDEDADRVNYVTLAVSPEQAQELWLITQEGQITLSLRGFGDDAADPIAPTDEPFNIAVPGEEAPVTQ